MPVTNRLHEICKYFSEDIRAAIWGLGADKASGPDEFPIFFYQKFWDISLMEGLHDGTLQLDRLNYAHVVPVPKKRRG